MIHKNEEDQKCLFLQKEYFCLRYNREGKQRMYEEFLKQIEDFIFIEDKPEKADGYLFPETDIRRWPKRRHSCTGVEWRRRYFQAEDTVLQLENLQECWKKKNIIPGLIRQNGNF